MNKLFQSDVLHKELTWEQNRTDFFALHLCCKFCPWTKSLHEPARIKKTRYFLASLTPTNNHYDSGVGWIFLGLCNQNHQHAPNPSTYSIVSMHISWRLPLCRLLLLHSPFSTSLWIIELFLSRGPAPVALIRCVGHQACFTAPSPAAATAFMLPHDIEEITHMSVTYFSLTSPLAPSQSFFKLPPA